MRIVSSIVVKKFISEMDLLRLQKALLLARMNADSTYLVDKQAPGYSSKLDRIEELFEELTAKEAIDGWQITAVRQKQDITAMVHVDPACLRCLFV
jgi:hypothetical protein